ncbi:MAG: hypothetical protein IJ083_12700 [Clostridia bacterium]|nr:hypothetical protein [Clostridia bacterium]
MNNRFLRYSLDHNRAIRVIFLSEGSIVQGKAVVERLENGKVFLYVLRPPKRYVLEESDVLACDYVRGDDGLE